jgi:hypothetical protein
MTITTNHFEVELANIETIFIFSIRFTPMIAFDNSVLRRKLLEESHSKIK